MKHVAINTRQHEIKSFPFISPIFFPSGAHVARYRRTRCTMISPEKNYLDRTKIPYILVCVSRELNDQVNRHNFDHNVDIKSTPAVHICCTLVIFTLYGSPVPRRVSLLPEIVSREAIKLGCNFFSQTTHTLLPLMRSISVRQVRFRLTEIVLSLDGDVRFLTPTPFDSRSLAIVSLYLSRKRW